MALDFQALQRFLTLELMKPIQVGLLGIGTVGSGTFNVLERNQDEIRRRAGRGIEITMVADWIPNAPRAWWVTRSRWSAMHKSSPTPISMWWSS
jgi:homoserine dehydrogenase